MKRLLKFNLIACSVMLSGVACAQEYFVPWDGVEQKLRDEIERQYEGLGGNDIQIRNVDVNGQVKDKNGNWIDFYAPINADTTLRFIYIGPAPTKVCTMPFLATQGSGTSLLYTWCFSNHKLTHSDHEMQRDLHISVQGIPVKYVYTYLYDCQDSIDYALMPLAVRTAC